MPTAVAFSEYAQAYRDLLYHCTIMTMVDARGAEYPVDRARFNEVVEVEYPVDRARFNEVVEAYVVRRRQRAHIHLERDAAPYSNSGPR